MKETVTFFQVDNSIVQKSGSEKRKETCNNALSSSK